MTASKSDVIVIGAGIFGLSIAWEAHRRGMSVQVLEAKHVGVGASGGIVGALTPHAPSRWRPMMAFQFEALLSLADHVAALEAATGHAVGYAQTGRVTPLVSEKARASAERDVAAAPDTWGKRAEFAVLEKVPETCVGWIAEQAAPFGVATDTVSARVDPRRYVAALAAALSGKVREGVAVDRIDPARHVACARREEFHADAIVLASGWQVWDLVKPLHPGFEGMPVKGQAVLFRASAAHLPVIYQDGLYMVPHAKGQIAVGSTSEKTFHAASETDGLLDDVIEKARAICPALRDAEILERWAGLRPKPPGREPLVGSLPGNPGIWLAAGGFKISFGIAHAVADAIVSQITRVPGRYALPESFDPAGRLPNVD